MTGCDRPSERFIGCFTYRNLKTGEVRGDNGFIALILSQSGRIPQLVIASACTLDELIAALRGPRRHLLKGGKIVFDPPKPFHLHSPFLIAEATALTLEGIYRVQDQLAEL